MFREPLTEEQATMANALRLAYIGDTVFESFVRETATVLLPGGNVFRLHKAGVRCVNCFAQSEYLDVLDPVLTDKEKYMIKRGENSKPGTIPHNADRRTYLRATGFETLVGYLYLTGREDRLKELLGLLKDLIAEKMTGEKK